MKPSGLVQSFLDDLSKFEKLNTFYMLIRIFKIRIPLSIVIIVKKKKKSRNNVKILHYIAITKKNLHIGVFVITLKNAQQFSLMYISWNNNAN